MLDKVAHKINFRRSAKQHSCAICQANILEGEVYVYFTITNLRSNQHRRYYSFKICTNHNISEFLSIYNSLFNVENSHHRNMSWDIQESLC